MADRELIRALGSGPLPPASRVRLGEIHHQTAPLAFEHAVRRAVEYIHAGDIFQANLSYRLTTSFRGAPRELFAALLGRARPWYGAYLEAAHKGEHRWALSISPELLLKFDSADRSLISRPIKGTRPAHLGRDALEGSPKDRAELNMIIDLMRNDLGRVAVPGSVAVTEARAIERHAGPDDDSAVFHGVATVRATLAGDRTLIDALRAIFPGGSITGAPKVRAMQIIRELEERPRGLYTGAIGFISDRGNAAFNIAIRTAVIRGEPDAGDAVSGGELAYDVGAGIVADSDPHAEYLETLDKARVITSLTPSRLRELCQ